MVDTWGLEGWGQGRHLTVAIMGPSPPRESSADLELNSSPPFPPPLYSSEPQPQLTPSVPHFPQSRAQYAGQESQCHPLSVMKRMVPATIRHSSFFFYLLFLYLEAPGLSYNTWVLRSSL